MYQEAIKYALKVWGASTTLVLAILIFINRNQQARIVFDFIKDYLMEFGVLTLVGYVIIVLWFRFKFDGEVFIKRLLTGVLGTFLAMVVYVHLSISISQLVLILFLVAMIIWTWYFELPMYKLKVNKSEEYEDILDA